MRTHVLSRRAATAAAAVLAVLAAGLAIPATPAAASLSGVYEETADSLKNSDPSKTAVATCPDDTAVVGSFASVVGGDGSVSIAQIEPDLSAGTVTVTAKETDTFADDWLVTARALCAPEPSGLVRVHRISKTNSDAKALYPECPSGKTVLSIGWNVEQGGGEVLVNEVNLFTHGGTAATSGVVSAHEDGNYTGDWTLHAFLLCADPIAGQELESEFTSSNSIDEPKAMWAECWNGRTATGGAAMAVSLNAATQTELAVDTVYAESIYGGTLNSFQAVAYEEDAIGDDWYLWVIAICT